MNTQVEQELPVQKAPNPSSLDDVLDTRSSEEIEAEFLKQAEEDATRMAENRDPAEIAAMMFHMFYPQFRNLTLGLSNKELRRLVSALIGKGHQSEAEIPKFHTAKAGQAYKMGLEILQAKFMMIQKLELDALERHHSEIEEAKNLAASAVMTEERGEAAIEKEETNGTI